jgi:hypothetical protein
MTIISTAGLVEGALILGIKIGKGLKEPLFKKPKMPERPPNDEELWLQEKLEKKAGKPVSLDKVRKVLNYGKTNKQMAESE